MQNLPRVNRGGRLIRSSGTKINSFTRGPATLQSTAQRQPAWLHGSVPERRSKPGRATIPLAERPRSVIDHLDVAEALLPRNIDKPPLALKIGLDLCLSRLPNIDHRLAVQHC
jgi:hypothetical protein